MSKQPKSIAILQLNFVSLVCLLSVFVCNNDLLNINRNVAESCCSTGFSYAFSWLRVNQLFWTSGFDCATILRNSLSVSRKLPQLHFSYLEWIHKWFMAFCGYDLLGLAEGSLKCVSHLISCFFVWTLSKSFFVYFACICCCLLLNSA